MRRRASQISALSDRRRSGTVSRDIRTNHAAMATDRANHAASASAFGSHANGAITSANAGRYLYW